MQMLNIYYDYQVGIIEETSTLPKHGDIILNSVRENVGEIEPSCFE